MTRDLIMTVLVFLSLICVISLLTGVPAQEVAVTFPTYLVFGFICFVLGMFLGRLK